ncbi:MAG: response regulator transcription factor [Pedobacter sp.]|nr:MAG: response regulator transcription factor [Pedobacter sp.]
MKILIIEDEANTARELGIMLSAIDPAIEICSILDSVEQSLKWFEDHQQPDLIFSDIQLADGLCFSIYAQVKIKCPIIFCSAFDEYLLTAFETNAISYLLKPVTKEKLQGALDKFNVLKSAFKPEPYNNAIEMLLKQIKQPHQTALLVNQGEKIIPVQTKDIACFYMENTIIQVITVKQQKYFIISTLDELEKKVNGDYFYRANRQFLINRSAVVNAERFFARKLVIKLNVETPETITVSKVKAVEFLTWLENGHG